MKRKHFASILAVAVMLTSFTMTGTIEGASRAELAAIHVNKSGNFQYWNRDSAAKEKLVSYVKDVTNPKSSNFIPVEHRLAVFDMDGTLLGERTPSYTDGVFYGHPSTIPTARYRLKTNSLPGTIGMPFPAQTRSARNRQ